VFLSAKMGTGIPLLYKLIKKVCDSTNLRITTGELNRFVEALKFEDRKIFYITQASIRPPTFIVFTDKMSKLHFSHERYLMNQIRKRFGFQGTPIQLNIRGRKSQEKRAREKRRALLLLQLIPAASNRLGELRRLDSGELKAADAVSCPDRQMRPLAKQA
jgi:hypothetical protein